MVKTAKPNAFGDTLVLNLGSKVGPGVKDVRRILERLGRSARSLSGPLGNPYIPGGRLFYQAEALGYVFLVEELSFVEMRRVVTAGGGSVLDDGNIRDFVRFPIERAGGEEDPAPPLGDEYTDDFGRGNEEREVPPVEAPRALPPVHGTIPDGAGTQGVVPVIVDCYGLYCPSARAVLRTLRLEADFDAKMADLRVREGTGANLDDGTGVYGGGTLSDGDAPAIFLCPESIMTIPTAFGNALDGWGAVFSLMSGPTLNLEPFLRMILLHELGHHFFSAAGIKCAPILDEVLANWFCHRMLGSPAERNGLYELALTQPMVYRLYHGFLAMAVPEHVPVMPRGVLLPWPFAGGHDFLAHLEANLLRGRDHRHDLSYGLVSPPLHDLWFEHWLAQGAGMLLGLVGPSCAALSAGRFGWCEWYDWAFALLRALPLPWRVNVSRARDAFQQVCGNRWYGRRECKAWRRLRYLKAIDLRSATSVSMWDNPVRFP